MTTTNMTTRTNNFSFAPARPMTFAAKAPQGGLRFGQKPQDDQATFSATSATGSKAAKWAGVGFVLALLGMLGYKLTDSTPTTNISPQCFQAAMMGAQHTEGEQAKGHVHVGEDGAIEYTGTGEEKVTFADTLQKTCGGQGAQANVVE